MQLSWSTLLDSDDGTANAVTLLPGGDLLTVGHLLGSTSAPGPAGLPSFSSSSPRAFLARVNPQGVVVWARETGLGDSTSSRETAVGLRAFGAEGAVLLAQASYVDPTTMDLLARRDAILWTDADGNVAASRLFDAGQATAAVSLAADAQGDDLIALEVSTDTDVVLDGFSLPRPGKALLLRVDAQGGLSFAKRLAAGADVAVRALPLPGSGSVVVGTGKSEDPSISGAEEGFILLLDGSGNLVAEQRLQATEGVRVTAAAVTASGEVIVVGAVRGTLRFAPGGGEALPGERDAFVLKLDAALEIVWAKRLTGEGERVATAAIVATNGDVLVAGQTAGSVDQVGQAAGGSLEAFLVRLDGEGTLLEGLVYAAGAGGVVTVPLDVVVTGTQAYLAGYAYVGAAQPKRQAMWASVVW